MSRKHPPMWRSPCPTCGGAEVITVRGRGIARVMGPRQPFTPGQKRLWDLVYAKWKPAMKATHASHDEDGTYHEPDLIGGKLLRTACFAEIQERVGLEDKDRRSIRVYWPQQRTWKKTLAWCPDPFHEQRRDTRFGYGWKPWQGAQEEPDMPRQRLSTMSGRERHEIAAKRQKAKARRHKEQQNKR